MAAVLSASILFAVVAWAFVRLRRATGDARLSAGDRARRLAALVFLVGVVVTAVGRGALGPVAQMLLTLAALGAAAVLELQGRRADEAVMRKRRAVAAKSGEPVAALRMAPSTAGLLVGIGAVGVYQLYSLTLGMDSTQRIVRALGESSPGAASVLGLAALLVSMALVIAPIPAGLVAFRIQERRVVRAERDHAAAVALFEARLERERQRAVDDLGANQRLTF